MPKVDFKSEFHHRYIKRNPCILFNGRPFFPKDISGTDNSYFKVSGLWDSPTAGLTDKNINLDVNSLDLRFPEIGWKNVSNEICIYFSIVPSVQWRFALTSETCSIYDPHKFDYGTERVLISDTVSMFESPTNKSNKVLTAIFNSEYVSSEEAYNKVAVDMTHTGVAFSKDLALIAKRWSEHPVLYYNIYPIGVVNGKDSASLFKDMKPMKETVEEYFNTVEIMK